MKTLSSRSVLFTSFAALSLGTIGLGACSANPAEDTKSTSSAVAPIVPITSPLTGPRAWAGSVLTQSYLAGQGGQLLPGIGVADAVSLGDTGEVWHEANIIESLVDYQDKTGDATYQGFVDSYDSSNYDPIHPFLAIENQYNDDDLWWALADIRAADVLKDSSWLTPAQNVFQHVCGQWDAAAGCGGGVPWAMPGNGSASTYVNAITNELFFQAAIALYKEFPNATDVCPGQVPWTTDPSTYSTYGQEGPGGLTYHFANDYLGWALAEYEFFKQSYLAPNVSLPIPDGFNTATGCTPAGTQWTYNQGPILGALLDLSQVSQGAMYSHTEGDSPATILGYGFSVATTAMTTFVQPGLTSSTAILTESNDLAANGQPGTSNSGNGDGVEFKGVFERYLGRFVQGAAPPWGPFSDGSFQFTSFATAFLNRNASAIWTNSAKGSYAPVVWSESGNTWAQWSRDPAVTSAVDGLVAAINIDGPAPPPAPPPPGAPHCIFPFNHQAPNEGEVLVTCTPDAANDPIFLFEWMPATNAWQYVSAYAGPLVSVIPGVPAGGQLTYLGCSYNALYSTGMPPATWQTDTAPVYPGALGCDAVAQVDVYPPCVPSFACEANVTCGVNPDGCGNTLNCGSCAAGSSCGGGYCQTACTTPECLCVEEKGVWSNNKCIRDCDAACACLAGGGTWNGHTCI